MALNSYSEKDIKSIFHFIGVGLFCGSLLTAQEGNAQLSASIVPETPSSTQIIQIRVITGFAECQRELESHSIEREGMDIHLNFDVIDPPPQVCPGTPPPLIYYEEIGPLPSGEYNLYVQGRVNGTDLPLFNTTFGVLLDPIAVRLQVGWALICVLLMTGLLALAFRQRLT